MEPHQALLEDDKGRIWFGRGRGVSVLSPNSGAIINCRHDPDDPDSLPHGAVGTLALGTGGADFVMIGGMFVGHDESGGQLVERNGQHFKLYYGMSSETAMKKHVGMVANYRASEGKTVEVPYRGPLEVTVKDILGGLRSTCTYVGASALRELSKRTTFIRVAEQENTIFG